MGVGVCHWQTPTYILPFDVVEVVISKSTSIGEAMRDLDRRKVVSGDFLVVHGDLVCNVPIVDALTCPTIPHFNIRDTFNGMLFVLILLIGYKPTRPIEPRTRMQS